MSVVKFNTGKTILFLWVHMYHKIMHFEREEHLDKVSVVGHRLHTLQTYYYQNIHLKIAWKL
jgi:hypothetical protein